MQLELANAQGELTPLERGMHALAAISKQGDIKVYAEAMGRKQATVQGEVQAARVAKNARAFFAEFLNRTRHLVEIHSAPENCWGGVLVSRMIALGWSVQQTKDAVRATTAVRPPRGYESLFALSRLQEIAARGDDPAEVVKPLVRAIERGKADIRDGGYATDAHLERFGQSGTRVPCLRDPRGADLLLDAFPEPSRSSGGGG